MQESMAQRTTSMNELLATMMDIMSASSSAGMNNSSRGANEPYVGLCPEEIMSKKLSLLKQKQLQQPRWILSICPTKNRSWFWDFVRILFRRKLGREISKELKRIFRLIPSSRI